MTVDNIEATPITEVEDNDPPPPYDVVAREAVPEYPQAYHIGPFGLDHAGHHGAAVSATAGSSTTATASPAAAT